MFVLESKNKLIRNVFFLDFFYTPKKEQTTPLGGLTKEVGYVTFFIGAKVKWMQEVSSDFIHSAKKW